VRVNLEPQGRVEDAEAAEDAEEVVVASEEDVQPHLDVVAVFILPAAHLQFLIFAIFAIMRQWIGGSANGRVETGVPAVSQLRAATSRVDDERVVTYGIDRLLDSTDRCGEMNGYEVDVWTWRVCRSWGVVGAIDAQRDFWPRVFGLAVTIGDRRVKNFVPGRRRATANSWLLPKTACLQR